MKIKKLIKSLSSIEMGFYHLTDKQYWSEEIAKKFHSQSYWKKIKTKSIRSILKEREENKLTKAMKLGQAGHFLILEGEQRFNEKVFLKREFPTAPKKDEYIRRRLEENIFSTEVDPSLINKKDFFLDRMKDVELKERIELPNRTEFIAKKLKRVKEPTPVPTQKEFLEKGDSSHQRKKLKEKHQKLKAKFKAEKTNYSKEKKKAELDYYAIQRRAKAIVDHNKKIEDAVTVEWNRQELVINQLAKEWSEAKGRLDEAKQIQKEKLEDAQEFGQLVLNNEEMEVIQMTRRAFFDHDLAKELHAKSEKEVTGLVYHSKSGLYLKVKFDLIDFERGIIADLKILDDIDGESFYWNSEKRLFKIQFAIYAWVAEALGMNVKKFVAITASKQAEEIAYRNIPMDKIKGEWLKEAEELLCQYARELKEFEEGKTRYDGEVDFYDPREMSMEEIDNVFGELTNREIA